MNNRRRRLAKSRRAFGVVRGPVAHAYNVSRARGYTDFGFGAAALAAGAAAHALAAVAAQVRADMSRVFGIPPAAMGVTIRGNTCPYCGGPCTVDSCCRGRRTDISGENCCPEMAAHSRLVAAACEAEEVFTLDELEDAARWNEEQRQ